MAKGKKYWEVETPTIFESEKNVVKVYKENGKIQVFPKVPGTAHGVGKGATIDLETMSVEQLMELRELVVNAILEQLTTEEEVGA